MLLLKRTNEGVEARSDREPTITHPERGVPEVWNNREPTIMLRKRRNDQDPWREHPQESTPVCNCQEVDRFPNHDRREHPQESTPAGNCQDRIPNHDRIPWTDPGLINMQTKVTNRPLRNLDHDPSIHPTPTNMLPKEGPPIATISAQAPQNNSRHRHPRYQRKVLPRIPMEALWFFEDERGTTVLGSPLKQSMRMLIWHENTGLRFEETLRLVRAMGQMLIITGLSNDIIT